MMRLQLLVVLIALYGANAKTEKLCKNKVKCKDYIIWGKKPNGEKPINFDTREYQKQGVWEYNVVEKENVTITYLEVNNVALEDCPSCKACILEGGVGYSYVKIGLVIPDKYASKSYYHRMIYGHWLKAGETPKPKPCTDYCESPSGKKSKCK